MPGFFLPVDKCFTLQLLAMDTAQAIMIDTTHGKSASNCTTNE